MRPPDKIEAVVATNTIWKNQSDIVKYPLCTTVAAACSQPLSSAIR